MLKIDKTDFLKLIMLNSEKKTTTVSTKKTKQKKYREKNKQNE